MVALVVAIGFADSEDDDVEPAQVQAAAFQWVGVGEAQAPRRDGEEWEVDVERPNGSLIEVTMDDELEMTGVDEELGRAAPSPGTRSPGRVASAPRTSR